MARAILFDLFETLMTDFHSVSGPPPWSAPGARLGIGEEAFRRGWTQRKVRRMTSPFSYVDTLIEICVDCGVDPPSDEIHALNEARQAARLRAFLDVPEPVLTMLEALHDEH